MPQAARLVGAEIRVGMVEYEITENAICANNIGAETTLAESFTVVCDAAPITGRHVFIQLIGRSEDMTLCEVEVMVADSKLSNLVIDKKATQSSHHGDGSAIRAIDGDKSSDYADRSCTHTELEYEPWWKVDLNDEYHVIEVIITNRADCCGKKLQH
ncbi:fucolectin-6-like [Glandiceps talaboti]